MNYDNILHDDPALGIDDYAKGKVREKIQSIFSPHKAGTDSKYSKDEQSDRRLIIIGHYALVASPFLWRKIASWLDEVSDASEFD